MSKKIGVIAEDVSDVETLYEFTCKIAPEASFRFMKFVGHGCGKLRRKCKAWAGNLKDRGCEYLIVVHDLDDRAEPTLRAELEALIPESEFSGHLVLIPVRELEAWLLCDSPALKTVFGSRLLPKIPAHPETLADPKKELRVRVRKAEGSQYLHTIHNKRIASASQVDLVEKKCQSFKPFVAFIQSALC